MNGALDSLVHESVQCWGCSVFDNLFNVVSNTAAALYSQFALFAMLIFTGALAFYILYAVWKNIKGGGEDPFYQKSIKPVLINSLVAFALLGLGLQLPRLITTITFEPVADMTVIYAQSMLQTNTKSVEEKVIYQPKEMRDDGFYRPQLRDKIILLMKTSITQFQSYIKLGFAVMDSAFTWNALSGIGALIKHIMMFFIGLYLVYGFFKLFLRFCFYFVDIIVYMTYFSFFFPFSLVFFSFKNSEDAPDILKKLGTSLGTSQIKNVINAIVTLAASIITYTVIMVIIAKFFAGAGINPNELMDMILSGQFLSGAISDDNLATLTLSGCIILIYIINFIANQIPQIAESIMSAFEVKVDKKMGDEMADDAFKLTGKIISDVKKAKNIITGKDEKESDDKKSSEEK